MYAPNNDATEERLDHMKTRHTADNPPRVASNKYYDAGGIETLAIIKAKLTTEQFKGWLLGNTIKYSTRLNHKGQAKEDAKKLADYSKWLQELYQNN